MSALVEISSVRQVAGEPHRRWFSSSTMDLFIWCAENGAPVGFQVTFDKGFKERALTWRQGQGYLYHAVDDGEDGSGARYKATPMLHAGARPDLERLEGLLRAVSEGVPEELSVFVIDKVREFEAAFT